jgi:hypothetical protein
MATALILLLWFPWQHVERGVVHIPPSGIVTVGFHRFFKSPPKCGADQPIKFRMISREWAEIIGTPGERVAWSCR